MNWIESLAPGAKQQRKLLALDGGGIRGIITIEVLAALETLLRKELGRGPKFVLADWFDAIAGTSTGAIIAACLSRGMSVGDLRTFYVDSGPAMFDKASVLKRFRFKFEDEKLAGKLKDVIGAKTTLGDRSLRTLLMMVMRNASTDSPWPIWNNPFAKYNARSGKRSNLALPLWQLVRASTAAPTYFPPESIEVDEGNTFLFVDGGITPYNNPAFQLFLMTTLAPHKLEWPTGEERMLIVSIGTGTSPNANADLDPGDMNLLYNAGSIPSALMFAALNEQDFLCRAFGRCRVGAPLDREVGDMHGVAAPGGEKLFTYMRYNAELTHKGLVDLDCRKIAPENVQRLDSVEFIGDLRAVGRALARRDLRVEDFSGFLD